MGFIYYVYVLNIGYMKESSLALQCNAIITNVHYQSPITNYQCDITIG